jgi:hypothetical protein
MRGAASGFEGGRSSVVRVLCRNVAEQHVLDPFGGDAGVFRVDQAQVEQILGRNAGVKTLRREYDFA